MHAGGNFEAPQARGMVEDLSRGDDLIRPGVSAFSGSAARRTPNEERRTSNVLHAGGFDRS
jgi:hypothetical protein